MSDSRPLGGQGRGTPASEGPNLREVAELAGLDLTVGPLAAMSWRVPEEVVLEVPPLEPAFNLGDLRGTGLWPHVATVPAHQPSSVLRWPSQSFNRSGATKPRRDLLLRFANLADASESAYLRFATRWGPLRLCRHGLPATHVPAELWENYPEVPDCPSIGFADMAETIDAWRGYATQAAAIIRITAELRNAKPTPRGWWATMHQLETDEPLEAEIDWVETYEPANDARDLPDPAQLVASQQGGVERWVNWWIRMAGIRPVLSWDEGFALVGTGGLFGALAFQLANLVHADGHISWCSVCGTFFATERKRQSGRRTYCDNDDCRERGRRRLSARGRAAPPPPGPVPTGPDAPTPTKNG
jgi:hypothetical protein